MKRKQMMIDEEKESLFTRPFGQLGDTFRHNKEIIPLYVKLMETGDDRSHVLLSAVIIEFLIDKLLMLYLPGYKHIQENKYFTHSMKEDLIFAAKLIPNDIL